MKNVRFLWLLSFHSQFNTVDERYFICNALFGTQFNKNVTFICLFNNQIGMNWLYMIFFWHFTFPLYESVNIEAVNACADVHKIKYTKFCFCFLLRSYIFPCHRAIREHVLSIRKTLWQKLLMLAHDTLKQMQILVALISFEKSKIIYIFLA